MATKDAAFWGGPYQGQLRPVTWNPDGTLPQVWTVSLGHFQVSSLTAGPGEPEHSPPLPDVAHYQLWRDPLLEDYYYRWAGPVLQHWGTPRDVRDIEPLLGRYQAQGRRMLGLFHVNTLVWVLPESMLPSVMVAYGIRVVRADTPHVVLGMTPGRRVPVM
jgi:hypothetical protein